MQSLRDKLYMPIYAGKRSAASPVKITIIGAGSVGMATAFSLLTKGIPTELVIVDLDVDKVEAEVGDLQNARQFLPKVAIYGGSIDVLAYVSWRISGFPKNRVLGLGTLLDSSKFCNAISKKLGISADAVSGYLLGEQGEKAVPIWSSVTCAGLKLRTIYPEIGTSDDKEGYNKIPQELIENVICQALLSDANCVFPLSIHAKHEGKLTGLQGVDKDIFFSLPCIVNTNGVRGIMIQQLDDDEKEKLFVSAKKMEELLQSIEW
ncbi:L-lactate dehydrogenase [Fasciola hepatica]|uniref:L-lactate dehydrogenase n=1 Tax=Fasciola hepatica TaxID=6192 RepID=A0A4E0RF03_FASHE|nr:L-lactate dehydrogenase [Fasciola hepatica]